PPTATAPPTPPHPRHTPTHTLASPPTWAARGPPRPQTACSPSSAPPGPAAGTPDCPTSPATAADQRRTPPAPHPRDPTPAPPPASPTSSINARSDYAWSRSFGAVVARHLAGCRRDIYRTHIGERCTQDRQGVAQTAFNTTKEQRHDAKPTHSHATSR